VKLPVADQSVVTALTPIFSRAATQLCRAAASEALLSSAARMLLSISTASTAGENIITLHPASIIITVRRIKHFTAGSICFIHDIWITKATAISLRYPAQNNNENTNENTN
jgi:hypothetical protein